MSQTETHFGKLKKVEITSSIEEWCKEKCNEKGINEIPEYFDSWEKTLKYEVEENPKNIFIVDGEIWEAIEHIEADDDDIDFMLPNEDGTITFIQQFYNGGTCLSECIESGLKRLKPQS